MPRTIQFILFLSVAVALLGGVHFYLWLRLVRDTALPGPWRPIATWTLVGLAASLPLTFLLSRVLPSSAERVLLLVPYVWMGTIVFLAGCFACGDLLRLVLWLATKLGGWTHPLADPARRLLVARLWACAVGATSAALVGIAIWGALRAPVVKRIRVELPRLPAALDGTTIAQLTDLHLGPTLGRAWLEDVVRRTNELEPDVIVITGDLIDGTVDQLRDVVAPLAALHARRGVYFVTGNHEYYWGVDEWVAEVRRLGIRVLHNERVSIGTAAASFDLAGLDDYTARGTGPDRGPDLAAATAGRDPSRALVLLEHQPRDLAAASAAGVGLQLSGHTHGGQFWPWKMIVELVFAHAEGLGREGGTWIYVSDGTGFWGPPLRLATTPEITLVTLSAPPGA